MTARERRGPGSPREDRNESRTIQRKELRNHAEVRTTGAATHKSASARDGQEALIASRVAKRGLLSGPRSRALTCGVRGQAAPAIPARGASGAMARLYFISGEIDTKVASMDDVPKKLEAVEARYKDGQIARLDGLSVDYPDWHFNVRASNTEPLLRLNLEAATPQEMEKRRDEVLTVIRG